MCRFVGPYTTLSPELSFVVEDSEGVCGYILAVLDSQSFYQQFKQEWLPTVIDKYPSLLPTTKSKKLSPEEVGKNKQWNLSLWIVLRLHKVYLF